MRPGDTIEVLPPSGTFTADLSVPGDHVFVVAGSGITPVLSLAATVLRDGESTVTVFYGNRRTNTVMFADELADLKDRYGPRLQLVHVLSREPRDAELTSGRLDGARLRTLVENLVDAERVDHWWLCGPHGMVDDARALLGELGVPSEKVHQELFYVDDVPPEPVRGDEETVVGPSSQVTIVLDGRSTTLALPQGVPVLDSAQKVRGDLPFACKGGVCGTCRARVTDGEVTMRRNYALEPAEVEAGLRADLPDPAGVRRGHGRLRRLSELAAGIRSRDRTGTGPVEGSLGGMRREETVLVERRGLHDEDVAERRS